jgi:ABC-2 type transport system permease protein
MNALKMLVLKDLRVYFSNRRALLMNLVAPILIAAFFGSVFGGSSDAKTSPLPLGVSDLDQSGVSQRIVAAMRADSSLELIELTPDDARSRVRNGKLGASLVFPAGFGAAATKALFGGVDKPQVVLMFDPSKTAVPTIARGLLTQHAMQAVMVEAMTTAGGGDALRDVRSRVAGDAAIDGQRRADLLKMFDGILAVVPATPDGASPGASAPASTGSVPSNALSLPFTLDARPETNEERTSYNGYAHAFAGMGVQFVLFLSIDLGVAVLLARRLGLWNRLRASPVPSAVLYGSRLVSGAIIAAVLLACIYAAAMAFFGVRIQGSPVGFVLILLSFAVMTAAFGLLIAALGSTPEATRGLAIFVTLMLVMLGGAWVPSFLFPSWLQSITLFVPTRWAIDGLEAMTWRGLGLQSALAPTAVMLGFSLLFGTIAVWRLQKE